MILLLSLLVVMLVIIIICKYVTMEDVDDNYLTNSVTVDKEKHLYNYCIANNFIGALNFGTLMGIDMASIGVSMLDRDVADHGDIVSAILGTDTVFIGGHRVTDLDIVHELVHYLQHYYGKNLINWKVVLNEQKGDVIGGYIIEPHNSIKEFEADIISTAFIMCESITSVNIDLSNMHNIDISHLINKDRYLSPVFHSMVRLVSMNKTRYDNKRDLDVNLLSKKLHSCMCIFKINSNMSPKRVYGTYVKEGFDV